MERKQTPSEIALKPQFNKHDDFLMLQCEHACETCEDKINNPELGETVIEGT